VRDASDSFATLVDEHFESVCRCLTVALRDRHLARTATEYAFARSYAQWTRPGPVERPTSSLYVAASRNALRRRRATATPAAPTSGEQTLERGIEDLPQLERLALVLHHHARLSPDELGRALRCSRVAARATLLEAYRRLGVERDDDDDIPEVELDAP
jgi:DNA-directed RNA polymerase specialized sigma24 family protein